MFASNMKILTLTANSTSPATQSSGGNQSITKVSHNNGNDGSDVGRVDIDTSVSNNKSNKREQKHHNTKTKFVHCSSNKAQQHVTQQQQQVQKYQNKNNHNNGSKLKNQHYINNNNNNNNNNSNNNNNNSTSSLNRKKYYQQHYHHQQQHYLQQPQQQQYLTVIQKNNPSQNTTTITDNNNSNFLTNHNYNNADLLTQNNQHNIINTVDNLMKNNSNISETCTCSLQQNNRDKLSISSCSSAPSSLTTKTTTATGNYHRQNQQLLTTSCDNNFKSPLNSNSKTVLPNGSQRTSTANICITCWKNFAKVPQNVQSVKASNSKLATTSNNLQELVVNALAAAVVSKCDSSQISTKTTSTPSTTSATTVSGGVQLQLSSSVTKTSSGSKNKSLWKNSTIGSSAATIVRSKSNSNLSSGYSSKTPKLSKEVKQHHALDEDLITNATKSFGKNNNQNENEKKYSTASAVRVNATQYTQILKNQISDAEKINMSSLASSSVSTSIETSVSNSNSSSISSSISSKQEQNTLEKLNDTKQVLKTLSKNSSSNSDINKSTTATTSSASSTVTTSQNSYSLDFLHSVGVKMTGATSSETKGPTNVYGNPPSTQSPVQNSYHHSVTTNPRQFRYMYGSSNCNNGNSGNQQNNYHHPQPSQLTIASFLNKDLLGADNANLNSDSTCISGRASASSTNSRSTNNYNDQQQQLHYTQQNSSNHSRYHHNYYATPYQQSNYGSAGGHRGEVSRLVTNCSSGGGQRNSGYPSYYNAAGESGISKSNTMTQQHTRHLKNVGNYKNSVNNSQAVKKSSYASSITSTGSSSSSKSIPSNSSNISSRQLQTVAPQESSFQTLPHKILGGQINQRIHHRGHHNQLGYYHGSNHQHLMINSPNVLQHQNYYNLTYVATEGSVTETTSRGCSPAPQSVPPTPLSATNQSPKSIDNSTSHVSVLMNLNANHFQYSPYPHAQQLAAQQQFHHFQQQKQNFLNKTLAPLSLNIPSSSSPTSHINSLNSQVTATPAQSVISCSQLKEANSAAAVGAVSSSSSSGIIAGNDYDSDSSSNNSARQSKYHSLNSIKSSVSSSSSSLSTSSISVTAQQVHQQNCAQSATIASCAPITPLHSPLDYNNGGSSTQSFPNYQMTQQPQLSQFYDNNSGPVVSLINLPTKSHSSYTDEDCQQQQQSQHHLFYVNTTTNQKSPDHLNISALTAVTSHSNNSSGYWSPTYHNNQLLYHQISSSQVALMPTTTTSSSSSCGSSSASISPRLSSDDIRQQTQQRLHSNCGIAGASLPLSPCSSSLNEQFSSVVIGNSLNTDSGILLAGSSCSSNSSSATGYSDNGSDNSINSTNVEHTHKRDSSQLLMQQQQRLIAQQTYQSSSSSTSSLSSSSASTLTSNMRGRVLAEGENAISANNGRNNQFLPSTQNSITASIGCSVNGVQHLPATPPQHFYSHQQQHSLPPPLPPHNILYNNPQTHHMRALTNSSISSSVHDFFTHTPPDRFLARAHLIEAKEAPANLLNNSKWDPLSESIWKKFINSQQTEETFKHKMRLWRYLYLIIKNSYPRYGLYLVGSTISGFGSDSSDVDMCLVSRITTGVDPRMEALYNLTLLRDYLVKSGEFENFNLIEAKVPILRFCDRMHQLEVDLNFNNCVGIRNTHLLHCYSQLDWRLRPLVLVAKLWAQYHNINNAKNMTISSYSLVLMVIHFLQYAVNPPVLPCLHELFPDKFPLLRSNDFGYVDMNESIGAYDSKNTQTIGELFLLFLEYYSFFDYTQFAISVRTGGVLPINVCRIAKSIKNDVHQWKELCIEEPFDLTNTARSVYDYETFERVKAVFMASWRILQETLNLNSIFSEIIVPSTCATESSTVLQNINSTTAIFKEIRPNIADAINSKINFEHYAKVCSVSIAADENNKHHNNSSNDLSEDSIIDVEGDNADESGNNLTANKSTLNVTKITRKLPKDLNCTLTPRPIKEFNENELSFSSSLTSSLTCIKSATKDVNINNKTATPIIS